MKRVKAEGPLSSSCLSGPCFELPECCLFQKKNPPCLVPHYSSFLPWTNECKRWWKLMLLLICLEKINAFPHGLFFLYIYNFPLQGHLQAQNVFIHHAESVQKVSNSHGAVCNGRTQSCWGVEDPHGILSVMEWTLKIFLRLNISQPPEINWRWSQTVNVLISTLFFLPDRCFGLYPVWSTLTLKEELCLLTIANTDKTREEGVAQMPERFLSQGGDGYQPLFWWLQCLFFGERERERK